MRHLLCALLLGVAVPSDGLAGPPPAFEEIRKIDVHSHIFEDVPEVVEMMDRTNMRIVNVCVRGTDPERLKRTEAMAEQQQARYGKGRFPFASTFDLTRRDDPDYVEQVKRWLSASFDKGALMVKIWKEVGMEIKDRQGRFILPDDPLFDPIYAFLTESGKPLLAHLAEPREAWLPLDPQSVHYGYYSRNPEWHLYGRAGFPTHDEILASRDRILERHPRLTVIGAHLGSLEHDVDELARRLDRYPNFYVDCSARTTDLTRQPPDKVRAFLVRYQDRVLYGLDQTRAPDPKREDSAEERRDFARSLEESYRRDFRYYAGEGEMEYRGKTVRGLGLPREVLEKLYHGNAERVIPGLAVTLSPAAEAADPQAVRLFNGKDLAGWSHFLADPKVPAADVWSVRDGVLVCKGDPLGYLYTDTEHASFKLVVEWRWAKGEAARLGKAPNSGVLVRVNGAPKAIPRAYEAQLRSGDAGDLYGFWGMPLEGDLARRREAKGHEMLGDMVGFTKAEAAEKPEGEWNVYEITADGPRIVVLVNGKAVNEAKGALVLPGRIGLQSEGGEIHFRRVELTPIGK